MLGSGDAIANSQRHGSFLHVVFVNYYFLGDSDINLITKGEIASLVTHEKRYYIFVNDLSYRALTSKIYRELICLHPKKEPN